MKKTIPLLAGFMLLNLSLYYPDFAGDYIPVFMERAELEKSVIFRSEGRELENPGKICYRAPYIFVNERYKGIHIINNTDPAHPVNEGYIIAPGCLDIAVKGEILYLDNAVDLVAFHLGRREVTHRERNVFPEPLAPDRSFFSQRPMTGAILVGWKKRVDNP
jgi:hypothetical protein